MFLYLLSSKITRLYVLTNNYPYISTLAYKLHGYLSEPRLFTTLRITPQPAPAAPRSADAHSTARTAPASSPQPPSALPS